MKRIFSLLLMLCMSFGLIACGTGSAHAADEPASTTRTHLTLGMASEVVSLDPSMSPDCVTPTGYFYTGQIFEQLLRYNQLTGEFEPVLATEWKIADDAMSVDFTLRQGVKFHNGDTMTADDVLFSLTRALESPYTNAYTESINHFEKIDDNTIRVVLNYPYVPILSVLEIPCWGIVSKRAIEELGDDHARHPVGTGAYKMVNWVSGQKFEYEAFEDYHGDAPAIKTATVVLIPDGSAGVLALEHGSIDYLNGIPKSDIAYLMSLDTLTVNEIIGGNVNDITFNCTDGIFTDKRLRQAVAYAIDLDEILLGGCEGYGTVANVLSTPMTTGWVSDIEPFHQDIEKAKQLMAEAGYPDGFDVVFNQDSSVTYMTTAEVIQAQLKKVGINVIFNKMERSAWFDIVGDKRDFVATTRMTTMSLLDADYILTRRLTEGALGSGNNYSGFHTPELDALIVAARSETDPEKRTDMYRQCFLIIQDECPIIPLYNYADFSVHSAKLRGVQNVTAHRNLWQYMYFVD